MTQTQSFKDQKTKLKKLGFMKNIEPNLCYKSISTEEGAREGVFDLATRQFHGRVYVTTPAYFEFVHMDQGQSKGDSVMIDRHLDMLLALAHKIIADDELSGYSDFNKTY